VEGACGKGLEVRQHKAYVAKKKLQNVGGSVSGIGVSLGDIGGARVQSPKLGVDTPLDPTAMPPGTVLYNFAPPVVDVLVDRGAAHSGKGSLQDEGVDLEIDRDGSSDEECSSHGHCPTSAVGVPAAANKGKQKMLSGQQGAAAVHQQSVGGGLRLESVQEVDVGRVVQAVGVVRMCSHPECLAAASISDVHAGRLPVTGLVADLANPLSSPDEGLGDASGGWKVVGKKKGKRKKKLG